MIGSLSLFVFYSVIFKSQSSIADKLALLYRKSNLWQVLTQIEIIVAYNV